MNAKVLFSRKRTQMFKADPLGDRILRCVHFLHFGESETVRFSQPPLSWGRYPSGSCHGCSRPCGLASHPARSRLSPRPRTDRALTLGEGPRRQLSGTRALSPFSMSPPKSPPPGSPASSFVKCELFFPRPVPGLLRGLNPDALGHDGAVWCKDPSNSNDQGFTSPKKHSGRRPTGVDRLARGDSACCVQGPGELSPTSLLLLPC